jgi:U4/U6.U5 tri-snRNP component SNU23
LGSSSGEKSVTRELRRPVAALISPMKKGVENFKRRNWDTAEYERLALEREDQERGKTLVAGPVNEDGSSSEKVETNFAKMRYADPMAAGPSGSQKAYLDVTKREINFEATVGARSLVEGSRQSGFHCTVCDQYFQDSMSLLDHVNGREHQSRLGFAMVTQRATTEQVRSRLNHHVQESVSKVLTKLPTIAAKNLTYEERVKAIEGEAEEAAKNPKRRRIKKVTKEEDNEEIPLGFASFGS